VYNLNIPYNPNTIKRNGYKGDNTRDGFVEQEETAAITEFSQYNIIISPNPSGGILSFHLPKQIQNAQLKIYSTDGKMVFSEEGNLETTSTFNLKHVNSGLYFISISDGKNKYTAKWVKK